MLKYCGLFIILFYVTAKIGKLFRHNWKGTCLNISISNYYVCSRSTRTLFEAKVQQGYAALLGVPFSQM